MVAVFYTRELEKKSGQLAHSDLVLVHTRKYREKIVAYAHVGHRTLRIAPSEAYHAVTRATHQSRKSRTFCLSPRDA